MKNESKKQFASRLQRRGVNATEIERRWMQHIGRPATVSGRGNYNTRIALAPPPNRRIRGRGNYQLPKGTFRKGGAMLGTYLGGELGGDIGRAGGGILAKLTGMGDYAVRHNSVIMSAANDTPATHNASFSSTGSSTIRVKRRECVGQVYAPGDPSEFNTTRHRIQASNTDLFPWGGVIARLFQEYEIKGCIFTLESTYSNYSAAGALGSVVIATQYNAADRPFEDIDAMLNSAFRTSGNPSQTLCHGLECDPKLQSAEKLLVRNRANEGVGCAPNNYDFGFVTVATEGLPAAAADAQIGRLYVTYDIEFSLPRLQYEIEAYEECYFGSWGVPKNVTDVLFNDNLGTRCLTFETPCGTWNQWIRKVTGGDTTVAGTSQVSNFSSNLKIGEPGTDSDIVLFTPTPSGNNVDDYHEDSGKMLTWLCGSGPLEVNQQCHFNFVHGGTVRIEFHVGLCMREPNSTAPASELWWIPTYNFVGADQADVIWGTDMAQVQIDTYSSKYGQTQAYQTTQTIPTGTGAEFENNAGNCVIHVTIKFKASSPHRRLSIYPRTPGSANQDTTWGVWGNAAAASTGPYANKATRFTIQYLK